MQKKRAGRIGGKYWILLLIAIILQSCTYQKKDEFFNFKVAESYATSVDDSIDFKVCKSIHKYKKSSFGMFSYAEYYSKNDSCLISKMHDLPIPFNNDSVFNYLSSGASVSVKKERELPEYILGNYLCSDCVEYSFKHYSPNGQIFLDSGKAIFSFEDSLVVYYEQNNFKEQVYIEEIVFKN